MEARVKEPLIKFGYGLVVPSGAKNLSANSDCLPPADQGSGQLQQCQVTGFGFFEADQKFTEAIEP